MQSGEVHNISSMQPCFPIYYTHRNYKRQYDKDSDGDSSSEDDTEEEIIESDFDIDSVYTLYIHYVHTTYFTFCDLARILNYLLDQFFSNFPQLFFDKTVLKFYQFSKKNLKFFRKLCRVNLQK